MNIAMSPWTPEIKNIMYDNDIDPRTRWFSKRHDFGASGWDRLVGNDLEIDAIAPCTRIAKSI